MATRHLNSAVHLIRKVATDPSQSKQDDGQLLAAFLVNNDQIAFATIIRRHGPMVLGICQRILDDFHAAEDAFQATFILLAQQANRIRKQESLASWLHGVGLRMARQIRRARARRSQHEGQAGGTRQTSDPAQSAIWQEIQTILDEEIQNLPNLYREPFIRHCLEDASCAEVAHQLGLEEATVRKRLARARKKLQEQLKQRGISLTAVLGGISIIGVTAPVMAAPLVTPITNALARVADGQPLAASISHNVLALIQGVGKSMIHTKMKVSAFLLVAFAIVGSAFGFAAHQMGKSPPTLLAPKDVEAPIFLRANGDAIQLPTDMSAKLGIQIGEVRPREAIKPRVLQLTGSTALDPTKLVRIHSPMSRCEVIDVGKPEEGIHLAPQQEDKSQKLELKSKGTRELRPGDKVSKGLILAVLDSTDIGQKKNELFDDAIQLKLDEMILEKAEKAGGAVPEVIILTAKRNILAGLIALTRAKHNLKMLGIPEGDIEAVRKAAREAAEQPKPDTDEQRKKRLSEWSRVELRSPSNGIIVERNVHVGEVLMDGTMNLFQIADIDRLLVIANIREEDLPSIEALEPKDRRWSVKTIGGVSIEGEIDEIGYLIDPNQHTAVIKGYVNNKDHQLRAGQYITASITLPLAADEMSLAATAVVEEKSQSFVFVQPDASKPIFEQRRIVVVRRGHDIVHVRNKLTPEQEKQGFQTIKSGERVVTAGAIELKAILDDLKGR